MKALIAGIVVFGLAMLGMALGRILGKRNFKSSCDGTCGGCADVPPGESELTITCQSNGSCHKAGPSENHGGHVE